jgi:hypothetical protein
VIASSWLDFGLPAGADHVTTVALRLLLALLLGAAIAWVRSDGRARPTRARQALVFTLLLLPVLVAMTTLIVADNVARAFGLVGGLHRAVPHDRRDTRDTVFIVFAVVAGMGAAPEPRRLRRRRAARGRGRPGLRRWQRLAPTAVASMLLEVRAGLVTTWTPWSGMSGAAGRGRAARRRFDGTPGRGGRLPLRDRGLAGRRTGHRDRPRRDGRGPVRRPEGAVSMARSLRPVLSVLVVALVALAPPPRPARAGDAPEAKPDAAAVFFKSGAIPRLQITVDDAGLETWKADPRVFVRCTLKENEKTVYEGVGVKLKGAAGSFRELDQKPAFTLKLDKFGGDMPFHGLESCT